MTSSDFTSKLLVTIANQPEREIVLGERLAIGRSAQNDLILDDHRASRFHAEIRSNGGGLYTLIDLGSVNGTWVNGRNLSTPKPLENDDLIVIGAVQLRFIAPGSMIKQDLTVKTRTARDMRQELVVVLVADVRNYTGMSEALPNREFSCLIADWNREASGIIQEQGGTIDKFIGDAVMAYWVAASRSDPAAEVRAALGAANGLAAKANAFSDRLASEFPTHTFRIGVGMNLGEAMLGNVGTGKIQSFTIIGDTVNVAFRLESLAKEKGSAIIASDSMVRHAPGEMRFQPLGEATVKGRRDPVIIWALEV